MADQLIYFRNSAEVARVPAGERHGTRDARALRAIAAMEANMEEPLGLSDVAQRAGLSERQLERIFKAETGKGPKRFYLDLRLERAERLINYSEMSMREVALATGFSSLALFSRSFKARYGMPPSEVRG